MVASGLARLAWITTWPVVRLPSGPSIGSAWRSQTALSPTLMVCPPPVFIRATASS